MGHPGRSQVPPSGTLTVPHPHIPTHLLVPRHPCHPGHPLPPVWTPTFQTPSTRPTLFCALFGAPQCPSSATPARVTFTRKAGGGVNPQEQQPRAQLAAGVVVHRLDGLTHLRPPLRGWAVRRPPGSKGHLRRRGPGPESRPCRPPGPPGAPGDEIQVPGISRGERRRSLLCFRSQIWGDRKGRIAVSTHLRGLYRY